MSVIGRIIYLTLKDKIMKFFISILLVSGMFLSLGSFTPSSVLQKANDTPSKIEIRFNHQLAFNDLALIKLNLAQKGITLQYKYLKFDDEGKLVAISFSVDCNDGMRGSADNDKVTNNSRIGFYRDYDKNAESPFGVSDL
jgi:hypothetical protein